MTRRTKIRRFTPGKLSYHHFCCATLDRRKDGHYCGNNCRFPW